MEQTRQAMSEDWLSVWIGLLVFLLSLGVLVGSDILGWVVTTGVWNDLAKALTPASKAYASIGGIGALIATYVALLAVMTAGAVALKADIKRFLLGFSAVFLISYLCWIIGSYANFAVTTPADMQKFGITWSLKLTNEGGFIVALIAGLIVGNFLAGFAEWMKEAVRPEWYIKTAIVILGVGSRLATVRRQKSWNNNRRSVKKCRKCPTSRFCPSKRSSLGGVWG
jgi:hypothetical protein